MAVKNHALDSKIINAAKDEFMHYGYQLASLHKIAEKAGITTGALYTRYKGKDDLFRSLVNEVLEAIKEKSLAMQNEYLEAQKTKNSNDILKTIHKEMDIYHEVLLEHYDACVLFYCKSQGSSIEKMVNEMMDYKIAQTIAYFKTIAKADAKLEGIGSLLNSQFYFFKDILNRGYSKEEVLSALNLISIYQEAGWRAVFDEIF